MCSFIINNKNNFLSQDYFIYKIQFYKHNICILVEVALFEIVHYILNEKVVGTLLGIKVYTISKYTIRIFSFFTVFLTIMFEKFSKLN